jgi:hypothetical protein
MPCVKMIAFVVPHAKNDAEAFASRYVPRIQLTLCKENGKRVAIHLGMPIM